TNLKEQIRELQQEQRENSDKYDTLSEDFNAFREQIRAINAERTEIEEEKATKQRVWSEFQALPGKIETHEMKKQTLEEQGAQVKQRLQQVMDRKNALVLEKANLAIKYAADLAVLRDLHTDLLEAEIWTIEAQSEVDTLVAKNQAVADMLAQRRREVKEYEAVAKRKTDVAKDVLRECQRIIDDRSPEETAIQDELSEDTTMDWVNLEIEKVLAQISLMPGHDQRAIQQFESRAEQIAKLVERVGGLETALRKLEERIGEVRGMWEPGLDRLVGEISDAFSHNFEKIGCAGEIGIHKDDDFDQWAIHIRVKFRENEPLSLLTSHRQSGGERAVSTIFYLMALQSLSRAPFRVVDEINQGMDPRNERVVHERMVDIACEENTSQYFLITPKLLPALKYARRMRVHVICSGEYVPASGKQE
ncbi:hypothetical protein LTS18_012854, partial [Coniosporium uncinatum]